MRPPIDTLRRILASGILAPSADNHLALQFQLHDDHVVLLATDAATWAAQPHRQFLAHLAHGAVVENMALQSASEGLDLLVTWLPDALHPERIAALQWLPATAPPDGLGQAMAGRHTNRAFYSRARLPPSTLQDLAHAAAAITGASVAWLDDGVRRTQALAAIRLAETERFARRELHAELFNAIQFDVGWQRTVAQGLPPGALAIERPMRGAFTLLRRWPLMRWAQSLGLHHALGLRAGYLPCALAPHVGLLLDAHPNPRLGALHAGRALQRVWLAATQHGLALQPMAAATTLVRQASGQGWVDAQVQQRLRHLLRALSPPPQAQPMMFFRLGRARQGDVVTARHEVDHYLSPRA